MTPARNRLTGFGLPARDASSTSYSGESIAWESIDETGKIDSSDTVVVDLGASARMGAKAAGAQPGIVILTHDDSDHIGGAAGFAAEGGLATLRELWVPFEWSILVATLMRMSPTTLTLGARVSTSSAAEVIRREAQSDDTLPLEVRQFDGQDAPYAEAAKIAAGLRVPEVNGLRDDELDPDVIDRVRARATDLTRILRDAQQAGVSIRYFSVDRAEGREVKPWNVAGRPGVATLANALEIRPTFRTALAPTVASLYAVVQLTIQNRRALCPVLWHGGSIDGAVMVWSDSSGEWLGEVPAFDVLANFSASTAAHHGSVNSSHDAIWHELGVSFLTQQRPMLCLGGSNTQNAKGVRDRYLALPVGTRACTRCRHHTSATPPPPRDAHDVSLDVAGGKATVTSGACAW